MIIGYNVVLRINGKSLVLYVLMNNVNIVGMFDFGVLLMEEGWKFLRIEKYGYM